MFAPIVDNITIYQAATFQRIWNLGTSTTDSNGVTTFTPNDYSGWVFYIAFKATQSLSDTSVISGNSNAGGILSVSNLQTMVTDANENVSYSGASLPASITLTIPPSTTTGITVSKLYYDIIGKSPSGEIDRLVMGVATLSPAVTPDPQN